MQTKTKAILGQKVKHLWKSQKMLLRLIKDDFLVILTSFSHFSAYSLNNVEFYIYNMNIRT